MPTLLFSLRNVPDDEAEEIRNLLTSHAIPYYETPPGNWGISMPGIWLSHAEYLDEAGQLLAAYQHERAHIQRELYLQKRQNRDLKLLFNTGLIRLLYLCASLMILYLSIRWVFDLNHLRH